MTKIKSLHKFKPGAKSIVVMRGGSRHCCRHYPTSDQPSSDGQKLIAQGFREPFPWTGRSITTGSRRVLQRISKEWLVNTRVQELPVYCLVVTRCAGGFKTNIHQTTEPVLWGISRAWLLNTKIRTASMLLGGYQDVGVLGFMQNTCTSDYQVLFLNLMLSKCSVKKRCYF